MNKVLVIGAGASGLVAAIEAAKKGAKVTIIEKNNKEGKKLLATGNGRCNITNLSMDISKYRSENPSFVNDLLRRYTVKDIRDFFEGISLKTRDINGYVYPYSLQAQTVVSKLVNECKRLGINILLNTECISVNKNKNGLFDLKVVRKGERNSTEILQANSVILSTGLVAGVGLKGESIDEKNILALEYAKKTGHKISKVVPGLTALKCKNKHQSKVSGVRWESKVATYIEGRKVYEDIGELQFADYGISGIVVFQNARYASYGLAEKKKTEVIIDMMPDLECAELYDMLNSQIKQFQDMSLYDILEGVFNNKLVQYILLNAEINGSIKAKNFKDIDLLVKVIKELKLQVTGTRGFEYAQVCAGGINTNDVKETMESKYIDNLYFTGEVLDVDGMCGGYNLHFAFASGIEAGKNAGSGDRHDKN